jgi:hypothetical protein
MARGGHDVDPVDLTSVELIVSQHHGKFGFSGTGTGVDREVLKRMA